MNKIQKPNTYKSVYDLADYLNSTGLFKSDIIDFETVCEVFEKMGLFYFNEETNKYCLTDLMLNTHECFTTKSGKILFTEKMFRWMTEDTELYENYDWIAKFVEYYNTDEPKKLSMDDIKNVDKDTMRKALTLVKDKEAATTVEPIVENSSQSEENNYICSNCGKESESMYTIREWCEETEILDETIIKMLEAKANELHYDTDICYNCFEKLKQMISDNPVSEIKSKNKNVKIRKVKINGKIVFRKIAEPKAIQKKPTTKFKYLLVINHKRYFIVAESKSSAIKLFEDSHKIKKPYNVSIKICKKEK